MTQIDIPAWLLELQYKLITALDAAWKVVDGGGDPDEVREALGKAKAIGQLAMVARKVGLMVPSGRKPLMDAATAGLLATKSVGDLSAMVHDLIPRTPVAAQAEHAKRALDKLKGGRRGRL